MATFLSKCVNQVLCIKPRRVQITDGMSVPVPGESIRFENGQYTTNNKSEIAFLRKHRFYGLSIVEKEEPEKAEQPPVE